MIRLSIIIPFYNVEQYIAQCLDSVYQQDIPEEEYEVICVDDCSPDNSITLVEQYAKKHTNLVIVRNQINRKLGGARNAGIEVAKGEYVWYVDSDDFVKPNVFKRLLEEAEKNDLDVLHFNYAEYPKDIINIRLHADTEVMSGPDMFFNASLRWWHDLITAWRKLYKRQFLLDNHILFAEHIMYEDNDYAIQVFANAMRVKHVIEKVYYYRNNPDSITRVNYTAAHVDYWLKLCHRLVRIKAEFEREGKDIRFDDAIADFIRNTIRNTIRAYQQMERDEKKSTRKVVYEHIDASLKPYISRKSYYLLKLHIL